jgi:hypothetical protein
MITHQKSTLKFDIKKGEVCFTQTEKYQTDAGDKSQDQFFGECPLDSDNLEEWMSNVCTSWIKGKSIRDDAKAS